MVDRNEVIDLTEGTSSDPTETHNRSRQVAPRESLAQSSSELWDSSPIGVDICPDMVDLVRTDGDDHPDATRILDYQFNSHDFSPWEQLPKPQVKPPTTTTDESHTATTRTVNRKSDSKTQRREKQRTKVPKSQIPNDIPLIDMTLSPSEDSGSDRDSQKQQAPRSPANVTAESRKRRRPGATSADTPYADWKNRVAKGPPRDGRQTQGYHRQSSRPPRKPSPRVSRDSFPTDGGKNRNPKGKILSRRFAGAKGRPALHSMDEGPSKESLLHRPRLVSVPSRQPQAAAGGGKYPNQETKGRGVISNNADKFTGANETEDEIKTNASTMTVGVSNNEKAAFQCGTIRDGGLPPSQATADNGGTTMNSAKDRSSVSGRIEQRNSQSHRPGWAGDDGSEAMETVESGPAGIQSSHLLPTSSASRAAKRQTQGLVLHSTKERQQHGLQPGHGKDERKKESVPTPTPDTPNGQVESFPQGQCLEVIDIDAGESNGDSSASLEVDFTLKANTDVAELNNSDLGGTATNAEMLSSATQNDPRNGDNIEHRRSTTNGEKPTELHSREKTMNQLEINATIEGDAEGIRNSPMENLGKQCSKEETHCKQDPHATTEQRTCDSRQASTDQLMDVVAGTSKQTRCSTNENEDMVAVIRRSGHLENEVIVIDLDESEHELTDDHQHKTATPTIPVPHLAEEKMALMRSKVLEDDMPFPTVKDQPANVGTNEQKISSFLENVHGFARQNRSDIEYGDVENGKCDRNGTTDDIVEPPDTRAAGVPDELQGDGKVQGREKTATSQLPHKPKRFKPVTRRRVAKKAKPLRYPRKGHHDNGVSVDPCDTDTPSGIPSKDRASETRYVFHATNNKPPAETKPLDWFERNFGYNTSEEDVLKEQERLLRESAARVRSQPQFRVTTNAQLGGTGSFSHPVADVHKLFPDHWKFKDPYMRLGLPKNAPLKLVKSHYRGLARVYHPDKSRSDVTATKFQAVAEAYRSLVNR